MRPALVVLEFAVLLLAVALVVADRAERRLAERVATTYLARSLGPVPVVAGVVWLRVRGLSVAGISLPSRAVEGLMPSLTVPIALPALPNGLQVDELRPTPAGLAVWASAENVVFAVAPDADPDRDVARRRARRLAGSVASRLSWPPWASRSAL